MSEEVSASKARKTRATTKVAEKSSVVESVAIVSEETPTVNDDGQKVITGAKKTKAPRSSNLQGKEDNTLASRTADHSLNKKVDTTSNIPESDEKVALWSDKNIRWTGVGTLSKGYNIVTKEAAEKWLEKSGIRNASPEEVATYYGK